MNYYLWQEKTHPNLEPCIEVTTEAFPKYLSENAILVVSGDKAKVCTHPVYISAAMYSYGANNIGR